MKDNLIVAVLAVVICSFAVWAMMPDPPQIVIQ